MLMYATLFDLMLPDTIRPRLSEAYMLSHKACTYGISMKQKTGSLYHQAHSCNITISVSP